MSPAAFLQGFFLDTKAKLTAEARALAEAEQLRGATNLADSQKQLQLIRQELQQERQSGAKSEAMLLRSEHIQPVSQHQYC